MLAAVLILTSIPPGVKLARGVVEHLVHLISQKLEESDDVSEAPYDPKYPHRFFVDRHHCSSLRENNNSRSYWQRISSQLFPVAVTCISAVYCQAVTSLG